MAPPPAAVESTGRDLSLSCEPPLIRSSSRTLSSDARAVVSDSIDRSVEVIRDQHRSVLKDQQVSRASQIIVVFNEARDERIDRSHCAILVEGHHDDVAAELLGSIP